MGPASVASAAGEPIDTVGATVSDESVTTTIGRFAAVPSAEV